MTIYAIGDIHGKRAMLARALGYLRENLTSGDTVVFLGDYIDRGEDTCGTINDLLAFGQTWPETHFVRGNHDQWMLDVLDGGDPTEWLDWGGRQTLNSYGIGRDALPSWRQIIPAHHKAFLRSTVMDWTGGGYWFVHAGVTPRRDGAAGWEPDLWARQAFIADPSDFGRIVVFGHTPQLGMFQPLVLPNKIGLDTGAVFGGRLSVAGFSASASGIGRLRFSLKQIESR